MNESFVPFIGIYSTPQYPMCLVFEYMEHSNLKEYLQKNKNAGRRELVRFYRCISIAHLIDVSMYVSSWKSRAA